MNFGIAFKSLLVGLFFGILATIASALIYTGISGTVPRQILIYGVIAAIIGFVANFLVLNKGLEKPVPQVTEHPVSQTDEELTSEEQQESKLPVQ